uniref:Uncharacterized protein n=1 Tax=Micrurus lemniscatus lemniscatus TaxID=129467 RepID=A0A2D4JF34_MICLE
MDKHENNTCGHVGGMLFGDVNVKYLFLCTDDVLLAKNSNYSKQLLNLLYHWSPTFLAPGTGFVADNFSMERGQRGKGAHNLDPSHAQVYCVAQFLTDHGQDQWMA